jgi:hypothetical protein
MRLQQEAIRFIGSILPAINLFQSNAAKVILISFATGMRALF